MIETYASVIPVSQDEELALHIVTPYDGPMLHEFVRENYDHLQRFQPQVATLGKDVQSAIAATQESVDAIGNGDYLQYRLMKATEMAGTITLFDRCRVDSESGRTQSVAKVGCYIGKNFIGRRFAPRASQALLQYAAQPNVWDLRQAEFHISDGNVPSQHVAQSLGARPTTFFGSEPTGEGDNWRALRIWRLAL